MSREIINAEDTCLIYRHDAPIPTPQPHPPADPPHHLQHPALTSSDHPVSPPPFRNEKPEQAPNPPGTAATNNADPYDEGVEKFPEGGARAWSVTAGSFCALFAVFGVINTTAVFQEYFSSHQLRGYSPGQIGWIFSLSLFLTFFCGNPIGPLFDAKGPRGLVVAGSGFLILSMMLLGECTKYWHFFLVYSILNGLGGCLLNVPAIASIGHFFLAKRGNATGIAMTSGSLGGIVFPLMLQRLIPTVGFAWATRILGFILVALLVVANLLIRSRLPRKKYEAASVLPAFVVFKDPIFSLITLGIFLLEWGIFVPITYITSYAVYHGASSAFGFQILALLNTGSVIGRALAGWLADMFGRLNMLILTVALCVIANLALWLPAGDSKPLLIVFALLFGFASGSNLSLAPVCVGQLCKTENYGRYYSTCWMMCSFG
ncbi:MAG: hypothetical protein LQ347_004777 [Umbilicaria vellea]|nr:MAG: hypothetical protein LQ347_004777 [Umbilicaria vellea]